MGSITCISEFFHTILSQICKKINVLKVFFTNATIKLTDAPPESNIADRNGKATAPKAPSLSYYKGGV